MRVIFCDDDSIILEQLHLYVSEYFEQLGGMIPEFACYSSGDALLNAKVRADIAFLDVEMPGVSGIHVGAKLKELNPNIYKDIHRDLLSGLFGRSHEISGVSVFVKTD